MKKQGVPNSEIMKKLHLRYWELRKILDGAVYPFSRCTAIRIEHDINDLDQYNEMCQYFEENNQIDLFTKNRIKTDKTGN